MEHEKLTVDEKLDSMSKRLKHVEINSYIHIGIVIIGFLGVLSLTELIKKIKK